MIVCCRWQCVAAECEKGPLNKNLRLFSQTFSFYIRRLGSTIHKAGGHFPGPSGFSMAVNETSGAFRRSRSHFALASNFASSTLLQACLATLRALGSREVDQKRTRAESCQRHKRALLRTSAERAANLKTATGADRGPIFKAKNSADFRSPVSAWPW